MAKYQGGKMSGKVGDVIHSNWNGREYVRKRPETVANPRTEAQQSHRNAFAEISRLSSAMKDGHKVGLHNKAVRKQTNTFSVFKKINKDCYGQDGIDYPHVCISSGSVAITHITAASVDAQGKVHVEFQGNSGPEYENDEFYLYVFCPDQHDGHFAPPVKRKVGMASAIIPPEWLGHTLHLYAFMKGKRGQTSNTIYVGQF